MDWFDEDKLAVPPYRLEQWQRHMSLIGQLAQFTNDIICIESNPGMGKTTFLKQLDSASSPQLLCRVLDAAQIDSLASLMHEVADAFGLSWSGNSESSQAFSSADGMFSGQRAWVLLIDNAHLLTAAHWHALVDLACQSNDPLQHLHLVLAGELGFGSKLLAQVPNLESKKLHRLKLEPMTPEESLKFLDHVLHHQGIETQHFSQKSKKQIVALANGSPQKIMDALLPMLRSHHATGGNTLKDINTTNKSKYLWLAVGAIAFFGLYGIFQVDSPNSQNTLEQLLPTQAKTQGFAQTEQFATTPSTSTEAQADPLAENLEKALASLKDKQGLDGSTSSAEFNGTEGNTAAMLNQTSESMTNTTTAPGTAAPATNSIPVPASEARSNPTMPNTATTASIPAAGPAPAATAAFATDATPPTDMAATLPAEELAIATSETSAAPLAGTINALPTDNTVTASTATKPAPKSTTVASTNASGAKKAQAKPTTTKAVSKKQSLSGFEQRLLTQKGSHYTIQILSAGQERTAKNMMSQPTVAKDGGYYRRGQGSSQKFVFVTGTYATRAEAQQALETLPPEIRKLNPFIRNLSQVKQEMATTSKVKSTNNG